MHNNSTAILVAEELGATVVMRGVLSLQATRLFLIICNVFVGTPLAVFGICSNIINMIVFCKQGISETVTISFFGLAISDSCSLLTYLWTCICMNPWIEDIDMPVDLTQLWYLTAAYPSSVSFRISCLITVFITLERCLCITVPMQVKEIITPSRTIVIVVSIFFVIVSLYFIPVPFTSYLIWRFDPGRNRSVLGVGLIGNEAVMMFDYYKDLVVIFSAFISLIVATSVLVVQLKRNAQWRMTTSSSAITSPNSIPLREKKIMKMVCLITTIFIVCFVPDIMLGIVYLVEREFQAYRRYENLVYACWSFAFACHAISASVNIFIYYNMSSRYRDVFKTVFSRHRNIRNGTL